MTIQEIAKIAESEASNKIKAIKEQYPGCESVLGSSSTQWQVSSINCTNFIVDVTVPSWSFPIGWESCDPMYDLFVIRNGQQVNIGEGDYVTSGETVVCHKFVHLVDPTFFGHLYFHSSGPSLTRVGGGNYTMNLTGDITVVEGRECYPTPTCWWTVTN